MIFLKFEVIQRTHPKNSSKEAIQEFNIFLKKIKNTDYSSLKDKDYNQLKSNNIGFQRLFLFCNLSSKIY